jgi:tripartite-type tricarboxylate transporter receptor subunit TctC
LTPSAEGIKSYPFIRKTALPINPNPFGPTHHERGIPIKTIHYLRLVPPKGGNMKKGTFLTTASFLLFLLIPTLAQSEFPEREITIYCSSSAGGITDMSIRLLSDTVSKKFGQPVIVVNKPGASSTICANFVANTKPDGYSIGVYSSVAFTIVPHLRKVPYHYKNDFTWLATCMEYPTGLVVKPDAPWKNLEDFLTFAKKNPGSITYGSDGYGVITHILMEYLAAKRGGIEWKHVPIAGGPKLVTALLGGHINAYAAAGSHVQYIRDGSMRLLVGFNKTKMRAAPEAPTLQELGYNIQVGMNTVIAGPKGLPDSIKKKLAEAYLAAMKTPSFEKYLQTIDSPPAFAGAGATAKGIEDDSIVLGRIIKEAGIKEGQQ